MIIRLLEKNANRKFTGKKVTKDNVYPTRKKLANKQPKMQ